MKTISMDDLLEIYRQKNHCRDIVEARTKLEKVGRDMYEHPDKEVSSKGEYLLLRLQEWDEQQKARQQANTPPPKQTYNAQQTNTTGKAPPQTNTAQTYPADYNTQKAVFEIIAGASAIAGTGYGLFLLGSLVVNIGKGIGAGIANSIESAVPYVLGAIGCGLALIAAKEFFTKKETPTPQTGGTGYTIIHNHFGSGTVTTEQRNAHT